MTNLWLYPDLMRCRDADDELRSTKTDLKKRDNSNYNQNNHAITHDFYHIVYCFYIFVQWSCSNFM